MELADGRVERRRGPAAQAHVGHRRAAGVGRDPVDAGDHAGVEPAPVAVEHADADQADALGDAVARAADRPGDVGAVAVAVLAVAAEGVEPVRGPAAEVGVADQDPGVDDVGRDVGRLRRIRERAVGAGALVDPVQAPRGAGLRRQDGDGKVALDELDAGVVRQRGGGGGAHLGDEPGERCLERLGDGLAGRGLDVADNAPQRRLGSCVARCGHRLQDDDVAVGRRRGVWHLGHGAVHDDVLGHLDGGDVVGQVRGVGLWTGGVARGERQAAGEGERQEGEP